MKHFYWDVLFLAALRSNGWGGGRGWRLWFDFCRMRFMANAYISRSTTLLDYRELRRRLKSLSVHSDPGTFAPCVIFRITSADYEILWCQPQIISASNLKYKYRQAEERHCRRHSLKSFALHKYVFLGFDASLLAIEFCSFSRFDSFLGVVGRGKYLANRCDGIRKQYQQQNHKLYRFPLPTLLPRQKHKVKNMSRMPPHFQIESHTWSPHFLRNDFLMMKQIQTPVKWFLCHKTMAILSKISSLLIQHPLHCVLLLLPATFLFQSLSIPSRHF